MPLIPKKGLATQSLSVSKIPTGPVKIPPIPKKKLKLKKPLEKASTLLQTEKCCKACGGTGIASNGRPCVPCQIKSRRI